ncbi:hypothetical protein [Pseudosulfitobacter pseudonitzschiae]|uniref:hypothetical protein n=1 Tax=Pseudosulfitobacter pseudonitzschiae TaxID=1402135 RepID=UPI001AF14E1F|nr:hypothetical protein [Pseudosulfitobacter pseudonitzschiae]MBM1815651.1 hypothetical protein [Pseudosulfitobacter pseudonitzschiae]MBM1832642.1 hypothetical protein [Pseudosulfitobacter pseudonitzschiae]MBM1837510.1 hypothetical protein [Pseudosulfitobacter pseudonitzschiae]MBM1842356.1 hypothetical protein [Pseudosulfitobacter pseudonitzschiae]MBM1847224.1 hypothetical protein [Pseudosulfitobacter pseudonitzschiae]
MTTSNSFQERLKRLEAKHGQTVRATTPKTAPSPRLDTSGGLSLTSPKTLMIGFGGLVSLVVLGSVLTVLIAMPQ